MPKRIFIGGLSVQTTSAELKTMFSHVGEVVSAYVALAPDASGRRTGHVDMATAAGAVVAISRLNGAVLHGSRISVTDAPAGGSVR